MQCTKRRAQLRQMFRRFSRTVRLCASGAKCRRHGLARTSSDNAAIKLLARRAGWPVEEAAVVLRTAKTLESHHLKCRDANSELYH